MARIVNSVEHVNSRGARPRSRGIPLFAALLIPAYFGRPALGQETGSREQLTGGMEALRTELEPMIARLRELGERYGGASDLAAFEPERTQLRRDLGERAARLNELMRRFRSLASLETLAEVQQVLNPAKRTGNVAQTMGAVLSDDRLGKMASAMVLSAKILLQEDQAAFDKAAEDVAWRRSLRNIALGTAALLVLAGAAAALWFRSRRAPPPPPPPALLSGAASGGPALVGDFQIERVLGSGGLGVVYEALDLTLRRKVALKRLRDEVCRSPKELEAFLTEARAVASLKHPHVAEIHGVLREGGQVFLVFEYVAGPALDRVLEERGRLSWAAARAILEQVAAALDYAHAKDVLHRDLKPSNILLTEAGAAKLTDFGLSRAAKATAARVSGAAGCRTDAYMAPELELGTALKESDLYSLGACLYEMAVGSPPFAGPDYLEQKRGMRFLAPSRAGGLSPTFDALIAKALQPDPAKRFHSASEMLAAAGAVEAAVS